MRHAGSLELRAFQTRSYGLSEEEVELELERTRREAPERWRLLVLAALAEADCNAAEEELLGVSKAAFDRMKRDPLLTGRVVR